MNANKQLINLAGILVVVVLIVAGIALVALPMYTQSQTIDGQARTAAQTNMLYEQQIAQLAAAESRIDQIDGELAELRREIASSPQLDDLHVLIDAAARSADVRVTSVNASDGEAWSARGRGSDDGAATTGAEEPAQADAAAPSEEGAASDAAEAPAPSADGNSTPQRQVLTTIVIEVGAGYDAGSGESEGDGETDEGAGGEGDSGDTLLADDVLAELAAKGVAFVDALRKGPRLVTPIDLKYEDGELTVTVLTYYRTPAV